MMKSWTSWSLLMFMVISSATSQLDYYIESQWRMMCPKLLPQTLVGYVPRGNTTAGIFKKNERITNLEMCVKVCCTHPSCNVVFMYKDICFQIECNSDELCEPIYRKELKFSENVRMVLVRPVSQDSRDWRDLFDLPDSDFQNDGKGELDMAESMRYVSSQCSQVGCPENEICSIQSAGHGMCICKQDYVRSLSSGNCILATGNITSAPEILQSLSSPDHSELDPGITKVFGEGGVEESSKNPVKQLVVSALSKEVRLPESEATLSVYTVPAEQPGEHYNYVWTLISKPEGSSSGATMNDQNGGTLKLSNLSEGVYTFKVTVSAPGVYGETLANVTVLPKKRINKPPVAVITPSQLTVKLPNTGAVLDGSPSCDDDVITSYHWELQQGPLGYQPHLHDTPTLQLNNLQIPGNYTFKLTVKDSDHASNSTTANITVLKVPDYPPVANAGQDIIIYLPHNSVTLNGSLSTDDKGIDSWEWTKAPSDQDKAVDMQNTRTPYLKLSNLEEGMYTFILKVTDGSELSDTSQVHVFVKPPTNKPPVAIAGSNQTVALPQTWALLNGSQSSDDIQIVSWKWEQISGPSKITFSSYNESITNATELTKGKYVIQLSVVDGNGNKATDKLQITVTQNSNAAPKANAGGDQQVVLPVGVLLLNGSQSTDDLGIAKWQWTREPTSLALGQVIAGTDASPTLMLTNVVAGRYVFRLRVTDDQGEWSEDTVSVIVKQDPYLYHLVELTLNIEAARLTKAQSDSVIMKLGLLLHDAASLVVRSLRADVATGRAVLVFYVQTAATALAGPHVVKTLKDKLAQDSVLLQLSVANIQTAVCQNNCSGHGVCEQETRLCLCEAFWMQDLFRKYFGDGDSNCDWSILYVIIGLFTGVLIVVGCIWSVICLCSRACHPRPTKRQRYSLIDSNDEVRLPAGKIVLSESESDSDVLFETRKSTTKLINGETRNGFKPVRNGFKSDRRVKTKYRRLDRTL
ncbi:dyslexia-associated protein KIAA0319-like [Nilaparvata lugens]|uniref:dyslexia-associated protein KIAA0319-like n=2 Tax=Nilaparvata lugens TaxID=108931 RepID=UPI00193DC7A6|nr:dyslexia-associated protein KIAA0319-like [Nilaparvata lugens]